ncbi:MAG TPA: hypothetical protein VEI73_12560 [Candidatus Acidoferrum sp.]|nr:hypothetical protein [Candidatus Acidoferrum sp.]
MNRKFTTSLVLLSAFAWCAGTVRGQEAPPRPPAPGDQAPPPFGERMELLGFAGMHPGKVVTGTPFSAVAVTETTQTLADGNHITRKTQLNLFRDSQGRVRREGTIGGVGPLAAAGQPKSFVLIHDPVAKTNFVLHPDTKVAENMGRPFGKMKGAMKEDWKNKAQGKFAAREQEEIASGNLKKEDLGTKTMAEIPWAAERRDVLGKEASPRGMIVRGTRVTRTIPAGRIGNEKPITIVRESWYSNDLQMVVMSKRSDPWSGETTYMLTNIQCTEPNASLFTVPSDYTVQQGRPGVGRKGMMRQNQAPPPPPGEDNELPI